MIRCLIVHIARNRRGQPIRTERHVSGEILRIGRGAECTIHLPDHRVSLHHAFIRRTGDGCLFVEGEGATLNVGGTFSSLAELTPGMRLLVGPYELVVEAPTAAEDVALTVELIHPLPERGGATGLWAPTDLAAAGLSKRRYALTAALAVILLFLVLPTWHAMSQGFREAVSVLPVSADEVWLPGPLSPGHRPFSRQCDKCHQRPFEAVRDTACQACHKGPRFHAGKSMARAGESGDMRCTTCHRDHKGSAGLVRHDTALCVGCHGRLKRLEPPSALPDVHDFETDHPGFSLSLRDGTGKLDVRRIPQQDKAGLVEKSGLRFSHKAHAGKVRVPSDPQTMRAVGCADCHEADSGGKGFLPLSEKRHCDNCHAENFDFDPPLDGQRIPHGSVRDMMVALTDFYVHKAAADKTAQKTPHRQALERAESRAREFAKTLNGEMGCGFCHETEPVLTDSGAPWKVTVPSVTVDWMPRARFSHAAHRGAECTSCHDVARSPRSADVAIPDIANCRKCHGGEWASRTKVVSSCTACHDYHDPRSSHGRGA
ncbi:MAG: cytochrome c3 family protein [Sulfurisoma sp.]|nr:cytochrome c3 family protein [Sulfurisoma sp.]